MGKILYPTKYVESVFTIDYKKLYSLGYRGIIFDIDNTLVPHGNDSTDEVDDLFRKLKDIGYTTLLLSNNTKERIERFNKNIGSLYVCDAEKPKPSAYKKAIKALNMSPKKIICIGDQLFTDIFGANLTHIDSILVKYIGFYKNDRKGIRRNVEKILLKPYKNKNKKLNDIEIKE